MDYRFAWFPAYFVELTALVLATCVIGSSHLSSLLLYLVSHLFEIVSLSTSSYYQQMMPLISPRYVTFQSKLEPSHSSTLLASLHPSTTFDHEPPQPPPTVELPPSKHPKKQLPSAAPLPLHNGPIILKARNFTPVTSTNHPLTEVFKVTSLKRPVAYEPKKCLITASFSKLSKSSLIDLFSVQQGTDAWFWGKLGRIGASWLSYLFRITHYTKVAEHRLIQKSISAYLI